MCVCYYRDLIFYIKLNEIKIWELLICRVGNIVRNMSEICIELVEILYVYWLIVWV